MNTYLAGDAPELTVSTLTDLVLGRPKKGGHVVTTINARLQRVAADALGTQPGRGRGDGPAHRRRPGDGLEPHVRPERAVVAGHRGGPRRVGAPERRPEHAAALARERRAVPARIDVQDGHRVGGARGRLRPGQRVAEPARAGPAAHRRHDPELRRRDLPGRRDDHAPHRVHELVQRDLRRDRAASSGRRRSRHRRTRTASVRPIRPRRPSAWSRRSRSRSRSRRDGSRSRATSSGTTRSSPSPRSDRTTTWRTRCRWRWWRRRSRTAA